MMTIAHIQGEGSRQEVVCMSADTEVLEVSSAGREVVTSRETHVQQDSSSEYHVLEKAVSSGWAYTYATGGCCASYQSHVLHQNADQLYIPTVMLGEDEKKATLGSPNQLPPAQGPQVAQFPHAIPSRAPIILDLELFSLNMFFRSVLLMAMEMALEELVSSFVKRSMEFTNPQVLVLLNLLQLPRPMYQILFKNLDVDMKEVTPSSLLKNKVRIVERNLDFSKNSFKTYQKRKDKVNSNCTVRSVVNQVKSPVVAAGPSDQAGHTHMPQAAAGASYQSHVLHQNVVQLYLPIVMLGDDEKKAIFCSPNQLLPAQGPRVAQFPHARSCGRIILCDQQGKEIIIYRYLAELKSGKVKKEACS
ncbi:hypothetical protein CTI12_AA140610 [Artemisia annua]|uniref:Uncharacterized protein n=1 Tax=Artemisia annua TaxID=35608 RepID=A0A2U1PL37_ARTAN|nr:hypothetical protein CTI12_AA140610 [Artemisia annua]